MKPGARMASAMEALEEMEANWAEGGRAPADAVLNQYFRQRRFIGSKDRGEISRVVYAVLRNEAALNWQLDQGGLPRIRGRVLAEAVLLGGAGLEDMKALCDGQQYCPPRLSEPELGWIKQQAGNRSWPMSCRRRCGIIFPNGSRRVWNRSLGSITRRHGGPQ